MNDKQFKKMDEAWMKKIEPLRDKQVSEGMLKGFSASVERRITAQDEAQARKAPAFRAAWAGTLAVLVLASFVVLRSPIVELAQVPDADVQEEIEMLKDLGVWDENEDEALLGEEEILAADELA